jgi:microcystin-dependent protein
MSEPFLGEVKMVSFGFAPKGWAMCVGQLLPINQNQALFSILGTTYGGDGRVNFALPDLRGRMPVHAGQGIILGQRAGEAAHTITLSELATHTHVVDADAGSATLSTPAGNTWAAGSGVAYAVSPDAALAADTVLPYVGDAQPHENRPPFLALMFVIALQGIFPSQN